MKSRKPSNRRSLNALVRRLNRSNALAEARATAPVPKDPELRRAAYGFAEMWRTLQQLAVANAQNSANQPMAPLAADGPTTPNKNT